MWHAARTHFRQVDADLSRLAEQLDIADLTPAADLFHALCDIIVGQQLSDKAASTIFRRLQANLGVHTLTPDTILNAGEETLRAAGVSGAKTRALQTLSQAVKNNDIVFTDLAALPDDLVRAQLLRLKGIGPWTTEMFLMFGLGRPDVFSLGDGGLQRAMRFLLHQSEVSPQEMLDRSARWQPYRTYAARVLWRSLDQKLLPETA